MSEAIGSIGQASKVSRLVATRVYGGPTPAEGGRPSARVSSAETSGASGAEALPFYANPAARVEAATSIAVGRVLDVKG